MPWSLAHSFKFLTADYSTAYEQLFATRPSDEVGARAAPRSQPALAVRAAPWARAGLRQNPS